MVSCGWYLKGFLGICLAGALLACTSCRVAHIEELPQPFGQDETLPERMTLVVWNVQKAWDESIPRDLEKLDREEQPDLLLLQEASEDLRKLESASGHFAGSWKYPWPGGKMIGVLTASSARPVSVAGLPSRWREFYVTAPKLCLETRYLLPDGDTLLVINVHLMAFERWGTVMFRSQLAELRETLEAHNGPAILAGDFNTWSTRRLDLLEEMVRDTEMEEVPFPQGRTTGDRGSGFVNRLLGTEPDLPIDRVFLRGFEAESVSLLSQGASDHVPLLVKLIRKAQPSG